MFMSCDPFYLSIIEWMNICRFWYTTAGCVVGTIISYLPIFALRHKWTAPESLKHASKDERSFSCQNISILAKNSLLSSFEILRCHSEKSFLGTSNNLFPGMVPSWQSKCATFFRCTIHFEFQWLSFYSGINIPSSFPSPEDKWKEGWQGVPEDRSWGGNGAWC